MNQTRKTAPWRRTRTLGKILAVLLLIAANSPAAVVQVQEQVQEKPSQDRQDNIQGYPRVPVREGDRCIVCNKPIDDESGVALLYRGRRVPVAGPMVDDFLKEPWVYFGKLQPRSALFHEESILGGILSWPWFLGGLWILFALISAALCSHLAMRKGLPPMHWFFVGLAGSFFALFWLLKVKAKKSIDLPAHLAKMPTTSTPIDCQHCGCQNHPAADRCSACGAELAALLESEVKRVSLTGASSADG